MEVSSFYPVYGTEDVEAGTSFLDGFGFAPIHELDDGTTHLRVLENPKGERVDVMDSPFLSELGLSGFFGVRVSVDDLDGAMAFFDEAGGERISPVLPVGASTDLVLYRVENGGVFCLTQHRRDN